MSQKITLVDDDKNITASVSLALKSEGFDVTVYNDSVEGLEGINAAPPELAILDIKMPRLDGIELIQKLRASHNFPVIFLTSKDDEIDEIIGLRMGADDYITKPFSQRLLIERIKTLLRRSSETPNSAPSGPAAQSGNMILRGPLELDDKRHTCTWRGEPVILTVTEYLLVKSLVDKPGHVKTRDQLITAAYGENIYVDDRTIDSHIKRIRKKFKEADQSFNQIETLYGLGYKYQEPSS